MSQAISIAHTPPTLTWTGERMIPFQSDPAVEVYSWQRYLYFRPWYVDRKVADAGMGEGYGISYASAFATEAIGYDNAAEAVDYARKRYPHLIATQADAASADYSAFDTAICFETLQQSENPKALLAALNTCPGAIAISIPNAAFNRGTEFDRHAWTAEEFKSLIETAFEGRTIRYLSQEARWPGLIREGIAEDALHLIAVIGDEPLPTWPRIGIAMPTYNGAARAKEAIATLAAGYPGEVEIALVTNGSHAGTMAEIEGFAAQIPHVLHVVAEEDNLGFAGGVNAGLNYLWQNSWFDLFAIANDDIMPAIDCLPQMVVAMDELAKAGQKPGAIGPVSNHVDGPQLVDIGNYETYTAMIERALAYHRDHHSGANQTFQVRGHLMLIHPDLLNEVGGFDPRFGLGNFEDDDFCLRARFAGYSLWIAEGAFLHHTGAATFTEVGIDFVSNMTRNATLLMEKWGVPTLDDWASLTSAPTSVDLFQPVWKRAETSGFTAVFNYETVDLVHQATDIEFAAFVMDKIGGQPREKRIEILKALAA